MKSVIHSSVICSVPVWARSSYWCLKHVNEHTHIFAKIISTKKYVNYLARYLTYKYLIMIIINIYRVLTMCHTIKVFFFMYYLVLILTTNLS